MLPLIANSTLKIYQRKNVDPLSVIEQMIYDLLHSTGQDLQLPRGKGHKRTSRSYTKVPHLTHPPLPNSHTKDSHSTGITLLFSNSGWVLLRPTELSTFKELSDGTSSLSSLSEKSRKSNHLPNNDLCGLKTTVKRFKFSSCNSHKIDKNIYINCQFFLF